MHTFARRRSSIPINRVYLILLSSKITGLNPSVQQKTPVPFSVIQGKLPSNLSVVTALYRSSHAQAQNPSGIRPSSSTMNSWPSLNRLHASIACPIGGLSPNICFESVSFKTVIFTLLLFTIRSPLLLLFNNLINLDLRLLLLLLFCICSMHRFTVAEAEAQIYDIATYVRARAYARNYRENRWLTC